LKNFYLDTGIYLNILGINLWTLLLSENEELVNKGDIAELFAGLEMIKSTFRRYCTRGS
jgi:uncharacterized protein